MKDYKRLTKWAKKGTLHVFDINGKEIPLCDVSPIDFDNLAGRLALLEDKIESGELVDRNEYINRLMMTKDISGLTDKEIDFFAKHNARVRENADAEIARLTAANYNLTVELEVAQRDIDNLTRTLEEANDEIKALETENAELRKSDESKEQCTIEQHSDTLLERQSKTSRSPSCGTEREIICRQKKN